METIVTVLEAIAGHLIAGIELKRYQSMQFCFIRGYTQIHETYLLTDNSVLFHKQISSFLVKQSYKSSRIT